MRFRIFYFSIVAIAVISLLIGCEARLKNEHVYGVEEFNELLEKSETSVGISTDTSNDENKEIDSNINFQNKASAITFIDSKILQDIRSRLQEIKADSDVNIITISPDEEEVFTFEPHGKEKSPERSTIYGRTYSKILLVKYNLKTGSRKVIGYNIPFIAVSKWNKDGTKVAFLGGGVLSLYDRDKEVFIPNVESTRSGIRYFGWNPDKDILYTEHDYSPAGSIYYTQTQEIVYNYETDISLYFKGTLNEDYSYATFKKLFSEEAGKKTGVLEENWTVITDNKGNIIKQITKGRYRDSYNNSMIYVGEKGYELYFIQDIQKYSSISEPIKLSDKYIYDAKFDADGNIIFVSANHEQSRTGKLINIFHQTGEFSIALEIHDAEVLLTPDGRGIYMEANNTFKSYTVENLKNKVNTKGTSYNSSIYEIMDLNIQQYDAASITEDVDNAYQTVIGAVKTYARWYMLGKSDMEALNTYFTNTKAPSLWAKYETSLLFTGSKLQERTDMEYEVTIDIGKCVFYSEDRADVEVYVSMGNSFGSGMGLQDNYEMIKLNGKWYVTGIATFSRSVQTKQIKQIVERELKRILDKDSEQRFSLENVQIGQIQFWQMSEPHHATRIEYSNYCKVFLQVGKDSVPDDSSVIYKIVLKKDEKLGWIIENISDSYLYGL